MPAVLKAALSKAHEFWSSITFSQRIFIAILAAILIGVFIALLLWLSKPEYSLLYSKLTPEDANRVIKMLDQQQIPYALEQDGTAILVPQEKVYALRIGIAGENMLTGQGIGFEIFDNVQMGQTDFVQKLNYRRALEGELSRTISEFPAVENARVHLVLPQRSLFIEEQQKPSAAVLLKLSGNKKLETKDVDALVNLIAMAVEGLEKDRISVADTTGKLLYQPLEGGSASGLNQTQFDYKMLTQHTLERRIEELLMPVVGAGKVIARVNAEIDFSQKTIRRELFDPEKTVIRSEERSEEASQGKASIGGGVPDPNFRGDGPLGNLSDQNSSRESRFTNFEINKEEHNIVSNSGEVQRLSVAVIVDGVYTKGPDGHAQFNPRSAEEMQRIQQLVASAVGLTPSRGDSIEVSSIAFEGVELPESSTVGSVILDYAVRFGKPVLNASLVFLFLILVVRPVVLALIRPKVEGRMIEELEGLPHSEERLALVDDSEEAVAATVMLEKIEDIKAHALQLSEQNMEQALGIIKSWLKSNDNEANKLPAKT